MAAAAPAAGLEQRSWQQGAAMKETTANLRADIDYARRDTKNARKQEEKAEVKATRSNTKAQKLEA